jgi:hypothetical protein
MTRPASVFIQLLGACFMVCAMFYVVSTGAVFYYGPVTHGAVTAFYIFGGGLALLIVGGIGARRHLPRH